MLVFLNDIEWGKRHHFRENISYKVLHINQSMNNVYILTFLLANDKGDFVIADMNRFKISRAVCDCRLPGEY